ncbi:GNAT family N-acetyltransferase [Desulfovibrio sp. Huiquan2017]|uniref:GNAT family N-acetyltransferase n=1 Tax=Desulfovibrio sp. Huiquan2017 TaxID=2816861 RepID=UPI001A927E49|nr:GNAT family N-acetyltransferase [Desulfovibrio sp. Huiquan2017]
MTNAIIHTGNPSQADMVVRLHVEYYARHWAFDGRFEAQVEREVAEFAAGFAPSRDGFWWAESDGRFVGAVAVDGTRSGEGGARLRWFIVDESCRGRGVGAALLERAVAFCRERGFASVHLWTFAGLDAARRLYERCGFVLVEEAEGDGWGPPVIEQKFELDRQARFSPAATRRIKS